MKRCLIAFPVLFLLVLLTAAGCGKQEQIPSARITVAASFYPVYIIAKNVAKEAPGVRVVNMTPPVTGCLHDYSATSDDMKKLEKADILLISGSGMESFMDSVITRYPSLPAVSLTDGLPVIRDDDGINPHLWVSLSAYSAMVEKCIAALEQKDPAYAEKYRTAGKSYLKKINALKREMADDLALFRGKKILTFHEAFPYFAQEYGLEIAAVVQREPGSEPSAKELADPIDLVRRSGIKALFAEPQYPAAS
ncbi:MAG: metal ABC transporter substrate-binding protein, partial [Spirochaetota bacterium]